MSAVFRYLLILILLALAGFLVYAAVAELPPPERQVERPAPAPTL